MSESILYEQKRDNRNYMSQEAYEWLRRAIERLENEETSLSAQVVDLRDEGTMRPDSASLATQNRISQVQIEISEKKSHFAEAVIVTEGQQIEGYTLGTTIAIRFEDEREFTYYRLGTYYDAAMSRETNPSPEIIYYKVPLLKDMNQWRFGKKYVLENGTEIIVQPYTEI